jgi:uncharacterized protein (TIGR02117 family)
MNFPMSVFLAASRVTVIVCFYAIAACAGQTHTEDDWRCSAQHASCATVFVVYDSWHAALVLPKAELSGAVIPETADFSNARYIEFSWGDQDYFPDPNSGVWRGLKAAFWSAGSVLHLVGFADEVRRFYSKAQVLELRLSPTAHERLVGFLSASFERGQTGKRAPALPGLYDYSRFYPSTQDFSLLNTCNTWVTRALQTAGLPVTPAGVITAGQLGDQLDKLLARAQSAP